MVDKKTKPKKRRRIPKCGRFWVWVEYKNSSADLDCWIHHAARAYSNGGGTMLNDDLRDLSFDVASRAAAMAMAKRIVAVVKLARGDGRWHVYVNDTGTEDGHSTVKLWSAGKIAKGRGRLVMPISKGLWEPLFAKLKRKPKKKS